jgi:glycosyltransferase involved in cell wall biosynthesis
MRFDLKLSIIIPVAGVDRRRNLNACISCINTQTFKDYEIIVVEQSMGGFYHYRNFPNWVGIKDVEPRGYNLSWGRNVGVKKAKGEIVVLMDVDLVFHDDYFGLISQMKTEFAAGAEYYIWGSQIITDRYFDSGDISVFKENFHKLRSFGKLYGYGTCLCFNREWFLNIFGGYNESFSGWGWEDLEGAWRIKELLNKTDDEIERIPTEIVHLFHTHDISATTKNKELLDRIKEQNPIDVCNKIKMSGIGDIDRPKLI